MPDSQHATLAQLVNAHEAWLRQYPNGGCDEHRRFQCSECFAAFALGRGVRVLPEAGREPSEAAIEAGKEVMRRRVSTDVGAVRAVLRAAYQVDGLRAPAGERVLIGPAEKASALRNPLGADATDVRAAAPASPALLQEAQDALLKAAIRTVNAIGTLSIDQPTAEELPTACRWLETLDECCIALWAAVLATNAARAALAGTSPMENK